MSTTPIYALPYPTPIDSVDVPRDIKGLADRLEVVLPASATVIGPGTPFPATPVEGQVVDYVNGATVWRFRYTGGAGTYKWVRVGGAHKQVTTATGYTIPNDNAVHDDPNLTAVVPFAGVYEVDATLTLNSVTSLGGNTMSLQTTGKATLDNTFVPFAGSGVSETTTLGHQLAAVAAGATLTVAYQKFNGGNILQRMSYGNYFRWRPVAVN